MSSEVSGVAAAPVAGPARGNFVFARNLPATFSTEEKVQSLFAQFGKVVQVSLLRPRTDPTVPPTRAAYVQFQDLSSAQAACESLDHKVRDGCELSVEKARTLPVRRFAATTFLFLRNLPVDSTEEMLRKFFAGFKVVSVTILSPRPDAKGQVSTAGYVQLASVPMCEQAVAQLNGKTMEGKPNEINVEHAARAPRAVRGTGAGAPVAAAAAAAGAPAGAPAATVPAQAPVARPMPGPPMVANPVYVLLRVAPAVADDAVRASCAAYGKVVRLTRTTRRRRMGAPETPADLLNLVFVEFETAEAAKACVGQSLTFPGMGAPVVPEAARAPRSRVGQAAASAPASAPPAATSAPAAPAAPGPSSVPSVPETAGRRRGRRPRGAPAPGGGAAAAPGAGAAAPAAEPAAPRDGDHRTGIRGGRGSLRDLLHSHDPTSAVLRRLLFTPEEIRGSPREVWSIVLKSMQDKDAQMRLLDLGRFVAVQKQWTWDSGAHISALANTISVLATRNIHTHAFLVLVGDHEQPGMSAEEAQQVTQAIHQTLSNHLQPTEACHIRMQRLDDQTPKTDDASAKDAASSKDAKNWFVSVEIAPQRMVVSFAGNVLLWDPLYMRSGQVVNMMEVALIQAELDYDREQFSGAAMPLSCAVTAPGPPTDAALAALRRDSEDIDAELLVRFLRGLDRFRVAMMFCDGPQHALQGFFDSGRKCGPRFEKALLERLGVAKPGEEGKPAEDGRPAEEGKIVAPEEGAGTAEVRLVAGQFLMMRGLPLDVTADEIKKLLGSASFSVRDVIITSPLRRRDDKEGAASAPKPASGEAARADEPEVKAAFVEFDTVEHCKAAIAGVATSSLAIRGHAVNLEPARRVPRSKAPRVRVARHAAAGAGAGTVVAVPSSVTAVPPAGGLSPVAYVLEGLGLWPYQAAHLLFGKRAARGHKVQVIVHRPTGDEVQNIEGGLAHLLTPEFVRGVHARVKSLLPEEMKEHDVAPPPAVLTEALVNAVAHADYRKGNIPSITIHVHADRVVVRNDIATSSAQLFAHRNLMRPLSHSANPILTQFLVRCGFMKGLGFGREQLYLDSLLAGCPMPKSEIEPVPVPTPAGAGDAAAVPAIAQPRVNLQWVVTIYTRPVPLATGENAPDSCFARISERLHHHEAVQSDQLLCDAILLMCGELCAAEMRAKNVKAAAPASLPLLQLTDLVGSFLQNDVLHVAVAIGAESPILVQQLPDEPSATAGAPPQPKIEVQLAPWAWELIQKQHQAATA